VRRDPNPDLEAARPAAHGTPEPRTAGRRGLNLGPLAALLGYRLRRAQLAVYEDFQRGAPVPQLAPTQFGILVMIDENPEKTQQELCEGIRIDKSTFAISLDRLADRGLLERVRSEEDRRRNSLRLTAKGKATLEAMLVHIERHERRVFGRLSAVERKQLMAMLKKIGEPEVSR
jgi:DNA-binding MarR family transcriptional regulator